MYRKITLDKISNLVRVTPTPYPFCIAWSLTYIMIKFISIWHPPFSDLSFFGLYFFIIMFFASIFAWARRVINTNCETKPYIYYIYAIIENYEKYGYLNIDVYRNMTFREFTYSDNSQLYEFTYLVKINYITGFQLFLWSEFMVFFSLIWAYCHNAFSPSVWHGALWPPVYLTYFNWEGAPQYMTVLLFASSAFTNWTDFTIRTKSNTAETSCALGHVLIIGLFFLILQVWEYSISILSWKDSIYSCTFYSVTAMHGLHVIVGMFFITIALCRIIYDPYIRIDGLYYKKLKKKNLEKLYDFKIMVIKNYQIISGRHLVNHFLIKKEYSHKLGILLSFFPYLFKPQRMLLIKVLKHGSKPFRRPFPIKSTIRTNPIKVDIIIKVLKHLLHRYKSRKVGSQWEQKFRTWLAAAIFNLYTSFFNRSLNFIRLSCKYLNKSMHKLKYPFLIQFGYFVVKLTIKITKYFYYSNRRFYFNWIYKNVYNLEYYSLALLDINIVQKNKAYPIFCNELIQWLNFQVSPNKKKKSKFIFKLEFFYKYTMAYVISTLVNYEKLIHLCFWFFVIQTITQVGEKCYWFNTFSPILIFFIYNFYIVLYIRFDINIKGTYSMSYRYWKFYYYCRLILVTEIVELLWPSHHTSWISEIVNKWGMGFNKFNLKYILPKNKKKVFPGFISNNLNSKLFEIYFKKPSVILKILDLVENFWLKIYQIYPLPPKLEYISWWSTSENLQHISKILLNLAFDLIFMIIKFMHKHFIFYLDSQFYENKYYFIFKNFPLKLGNTSMKNENYHKKVTIIYYKYWSYFNFNLFNFNRMDNFYIFEYYLIKRRYIKNLIKLYKKVYYIKKYVVVKHLTIFFYCLKYMLTNNNKKISVKYSLFLNYILFLKSYKIKSQYYYLNWYNTIGYLSYTNSQYLYYLNCFFSKNRLNFLQLIFKRIKFKFIKGVVILKKLYFTYPIKPIFLKKYYHLNNINKAILKELFNSFCEVRRNSWKTLKNFISDFPKYLFRGYCLLGTIKNIVQLIKSYKSSSPWKRCQNGIIFIGLSTFSWYYYTLNTGYFFFEVLEYRIFMGLSTFSWDYYTLNTEYFFFETLEYIFIYFIVLFSIIINWEFNSLFYKKILKKNNYLIFKQCIKFFENLMCIGLLLKFYKFSTGCYYYNCYSVVRYIQPYKNFFNHRYNKYRLLFYDNFIKAIILTYSSKFIIVKYFYNWQFPLKHLKFLKHNNFIEGTDYIFNFLYYFSVSYLYNLVGILSIWALLYKLLNTPLFKNIVRYLINFYIILFNINYWSIYFAMIYLILFTKAIHYWILEITFNCILIDTLNYYKGLNKIIYKLFSYFSRTLIKRKFYFNKFKWYYLNFSTTEWFIFFRTSAWYWHFVDIIWFIVYAVCYVM